MTNALSYWDANAVVLKILPAWEPLENPVQVKVLISEIWDRVGEAVFLGSSPGRLPRPVRGHRVGYKVLNVLSSAVRSQRTGFPRGGRTEAHSMSKGHP